MSKQIAVRLPDGTVDKIDSLVASGETSSRAAFIASALEREFRRRLAERDALIYWQGRDDPDDLGELATWAAAQPLDLD